MSHAWIQKSLSEKVQPQPDQVFLLSFFGGWGEGERIQLPPKADQRWPNIECRLDSFVIFQGIQTSTAKQPYKFVIFQGVWTPWTLFWSMHGF